MITCQLMGGLGNQLFQIFATIACAIENHHTFRFLNVETLGGGSTTPRPTYWTTLLSNLRIFLMDELPVSLCVLKEQRFAYTPITLPSAPALPDILLSGYFQSDKYFNDHFHTIFRMLSLSKKREKLLDKMGKTLADFQHTIGMHFRIGDYKKIPECHPLAPVEYYAAALDCLVKNIKNNLKAEGVVFTVYYFCEEVDLEEVQGHIAHLSAQTPDVTFIRGSGSDWEQLLWLSCCNHTIIANSTFSWWAAYLNPWTDKRVYYPAQWFGSAMQHHDTRDLFPAGWVKI
jgi:hypothetical protein